MYVVVQTRVKPKHSVTKAGNDSYQASGFAFPQFPVQMPAIPYKFYVDPAYRDFVGYGIVNLSVSNGQYDSLEITKYGHVFVPLNSDQIANLTDFMNPIVSAFDAIRNEQAAPVATGSTAEMQMLQQQMMQQAEFNKQLMEMMRGGGNTSSSHAAPVTQRPSVVSPVDK